MTHASTFSGIGGPEVAAAMLGWDNLFHCEINNFGRSVLQYWFPNSKSYDDITQTDFSQWRGKVDVLTGGFPCQPFSYAGKRRGSEDDRYLWPFMLRCIEQVRPTWFVGENVTGITTMVLPGEDAKVGEQTDLFGESHEIYEKRERYVLEEICENLERAGYSVQPFVIPACAVGAPHRRDRVFIVAHRNAEVDTDERRDATNTESNGGAGRPEGTSGKAERPHGQSDEQSNECGSFRNAQRPAAHSDNFQRDGMLRTPRQQRPLRDQPEHGQTVPKARHGVDLLSDACVSCQHRTSPNSRLANGSEPFGNGMERTSSDTESKQGVGLRFEQRETCQPKPCQFGGGDCKDGSVWRTSADTECLRHAEGMSDLSVQAETSSINSADNIGNTEINGRADRGKDAGLLPRPAAERRSSTDTDLQRYDKSNTATEPSKEERFDSKADIDWRDTIGLLPEQRWRTFPTVSPVYRGNDGLPFPVDHITIPFSEWKRESLKAYGNAIVPQVMYEIFRAIDVIEKSNQE